ncbi:26S proteasome regulatory subunit N2 [Strigomonas culicis]|uniref:26S proteasome regulatory subunit N2 n=1 Tax=Strigomonas culicis TaxID=28005 RepID=S9U654_9TRYP|nr:26S proteasome regulatory subunit N2 [Strigomonas culicis]|eukprot:EPY24234.1 26S proteasome regulatory subunit N2 [Strigomonas culicis]
MSCGVSSAKAALALLHDTDNSVLVFALKRVVQLMDTYWCEASAELPIIEELYESASLTDEARQLAALAASQVYFHLGAYDESIHFALAAGNVFDGAVRSLYTDTLLSRCIDRYVAYQEQLPEARGELDPRLETLFVSLTRSWMLQGESVADVKEMVGFTIRARRIDFLERVLRQCLERPAPAASSSTAPTPGAEILSYTFYVANTVLQDIAFRRRVLTLLVSLYTDNRALSTDCFALAQCLVFLGDASSTAQLIDDLMKDAKDPKGSRALAFQVAFDLFESCNQGFLATLVRELEVRNPPLGTVVAKRAEGGVTNADEEDESSAAPAATSTVDPKLLRVLSGEITTDLNTKFLYARCVADVHVLNQIKKRINPHKSILHNGTVIASALMYCGTTIDGFLRDNLNWLRKANYWAQFTATASFGVIHRGNVECAMTVLESYLPGNSVQPLAHREGGALYALGLIQAPLGLLRDRKVVDYLRDTLLRLTYNAQVVHGASLGLGLAAMGLQEEALYDILFTCLTGSDAVGGEGAAVGIGMLMLGSANEMAVQSLKNVASEENQKEKVIRGCCMALALLHLGREDEALPLAEELLESPDPGIRMGGCFVLGLAYAGTESTRAMEKLLTVTVRDTNDDVRRNAVMMVGFISFTNPLLCLDLVRVLVDSYNPQIRYGVAMALAIAAAGTGNSEVIDVLWEMRTDIVDYVRQGAFIGLALVMVQLSESENTKVKEFRENIDAKIRDRREDVCNKFGCVLAAGIIDAGGRNSIFALHRDRHRLDKAVVGMFCFSQYWYWFPYTLLLSLAVRPTCFIGLNDELEMPEYAFTSCVPPSRFAPPSRCCRRRRRTRRRSRRSCCPPRERRRNCA